MNKRRQRLVRILDKDGLAKAINAAIASRFDGNLMKAARQMRISQPQLFRLANRKTGSITWRTFAALRRLIPNRRRGALEEALLAPEARSALLQYKLWLTHYDLRPDYSINEPLFGTEEPRYHYSSPSIAQRLFGRKARDKVLLTVELVIQELRTMFPDLFDRFDGFLVTHGHLAQRAQIALQRTVEPLCHREVTMEIERGWPDLSDQELRTFVWAGMRREMILLKRSPDVQRAQEVWS